MQVASTVEVVCVPGYMRAGGELAEAQYGNEKKVNEFLAVHSTIIVASVVASNIQCLTQHVDILRYRISILHH